MNDETTHKFPIGAVVHLAKAWSMEREEWIRRGAKSDERPKTKGRAVVIAYPNDSPFDSQYVVVQWAQPTSAGLPNCSAEREKDLVFSEGEDIAVLTYADAIEDMQLLLAGLRLRTDLSEHVIGAVRADLEPALKQLHVDALNRQKGTT